MSKGRKKWGKVNISSKRSVEGIAANFVRYMELAKAARGYLRATRRFNQKVDFRLYTEIEFCLGALEFFFKVSKSFVADVQQTIRLDEKAFKEEVEKFCDGIIPKKSVLVTKNLEGEMAQIIGRNKSSKGGKIIL